MPAAAFSTAALPDMKDSSMSVSEARCAPQRWSRLSSMPRTLAPVFCFTVFSDLGDLSRPMTESEKALIQGYVERGYQTFLSRCAEGRGMTTEAVNAIGQGRVWTGEQAKERGLVDELGGIELAISTAAGLADLDQYSVTTVSGSKNFLDEFLESQLGEVKLSIVKNVLGNEFEYFKTLNNIKTNCGIQARMPYDMKPL